MTGVSKAVWLVALAKLALHAASSARGYGIFGDELYYLACAAHPDFGYVDHPPLSIWLLAGWTALFGDSLAALFAAALPFVNLDDFEWNPWLIGGLAVAAALTVAAALPHLKAGGAGAIVNIGGVSGHTGAKGRAHVVAAKAGLVGFTKALAHELAADGITANCVVPGLIGTERDPNVPLPQHHSVGRTLAGRLGAPEEIAAAVCFLAGPQARYITGQALHVNGGMYLG